ncbi:cation transport protein ChaC [Sphaerotilus hippei]|uniref:glutathione-specific gamma-glutamylcyclotransferase n=1 Tax=Sphaerotilus hippei TaxID=744406 RepID=A0A318H572_9BURK|nr:gamma-glutamylcyclotransferase [Sphaerotilus hippei]PXW98567.1 cation transport protein ChaC [Sphaerotilus hippei]
MHEPTLSPEQHLHRQHLFRQVQAEAARQPRLWVFAYASLLWRPEFVSDEARPARVWGYHRTLSMRSNINRGSPQRPGLVYALMRGGSCRGQVQAVPPHRRDETLQALWTREMPTGVYQPRWLTCQTARGAVRALTFTLPQHSPHHTGPLSDEALVEVFRHAEGRYGRCIDYLRLTAERLRELQIHDAQTERLMRLVRHHGLA